MKSEKLRSPHSTGVTHSWHQAYASVFMESGFSDKIGRIKYAIGAIERRYSNWGTDPGSPAEQVAIQNCFSVLKRLMKQEQLRQSDAGLSGE